jgi:hypothetical protein
MAALLHAYRGYNRQNFNWSRVRHAQLTAPVLAEREQNLTYFLIAAHSDTVA